MISRKGHNPGCIRLVAGLVLLLCFGSCAIDDDRDLCCGQPSNAMRYTYRPHGAEEFDLHIFSLRHLLFDGEGTFIREIEPGADPKLQPLSLAAGRYTMLTLGNMTGNSILNHEDFPQLDQLLLAPAASFEGRKGIFGNTDELFWGVRHFDVDEDGLIHDFGPDRRWSDYRAPATEMNNIHCHLTVKVEWNNMPDGFGDYEMELTGVPTACLLDPGEARKAGGFIVPAHHSTGRHRLRVPLEGYELNTDFVTLRYTDDVIPTLRIYYAGEQVSPNIDLKQAFRKWGWYPSQIHVQEYAIRVTLFANGRAEVSPMFEGTVSDWINGGSFS